MQRLRGETLAARIKRRRLGWRRALTIAESIAAALDAAHAKRLIHRDLKPQNVFLHKSEGREQVYVIDWGIAALADIAETPAEGGGGSALPRASAGEQATQQTGTAEISEHAQNDAR